MSTPYSMAGGFALRDEAGRLLLVHQAYGDRVWDFVGGGAEAGESPEETAIREAKEEIGLIVEPRGLIGVYFNRPRRILVFIFAGVVTDGTLALQEDEIAEIGWFAPDNLPALNAWKARQVADVFEWTGEAFLRTRE
jgi:8-oxo-dGTP pyrophosphatase MutT (NUDIX family)